METITIKNFLDKNDYTSIEKLEKTPKPFFDYEGVYRGAQTSTQQWIAPKSTFAKSITEKLNAHKHLKNNTIDGIQILQAIKPYDVHSDYIVQDNHVPISDPNTNPPTYTIVIPIIDGNYSTIIFDQLALFNNFMDYKENNPILEKYCSNEDWQKYCSHCHHDDQKYLTIKEVFNWTKGTLFAFNRKSFHCSSNFGNTSKKAIVIWLSK